MLYKSTIEKIEKSIKEDKKIYKKVTGKRCSTFKLIVMYLNLLTNYD